MGSVGIGFTVNKGARVTVTPHEKNTICFNGKQINFPTVASVMNKLRVDKLRVDILSLLPLGYGFGISAASSLGAAWAINKLLRLKKTENQLAEIAHISEIENKTGLGSVGTQITGGFLFKTKPGFPVKAIKYPFLGHKIYVAIIDRFITTEVLNNRSSWRFINKAADDTLEKLKQISSPTLDDMIDASFDFANQAKLLYHGKLKEIIIKIKNKGNHATMSILGQVVVASCKLTGTDFPVEELTITNDHVRLLD